MGAEIFWKMDILEPAEDRPKDHDFTAEYTVLGEKVTILGRDHRYLDYPANVFLNVCMTWDDTIEIADFCLNLLTEISLVNWFTGVLPPELKGCPFGGRDGYSFDREGGKVELRVPSRSISLHNGYRYIAYLQEWCREGGAPRHSERELPPG